VTPYNKATLQRNTFEEFQIFATLFE